MFDEEGTVCLAAFSER